MLKESLVTIGINGPAGSGKSALAKMIRDTVNEFTLLENCVTWIRISQIIYDNFRISRKEKMLHMPTDVDEFKKLDPQKHRDDLIRYATVARIAHGEQYFLHFALDKLYEIKRLFRPARIILIFDNIGSAYEAEFWAECSRFYHHISIAYPYKCRNVKRYNIPSGESWPNDSRGPVIDVPQAGHITSAKISTAAALLIQELLTTPLRSDEKLDSKQDDKHHDFAATWRTEVLGFNRAIDPAAIRSRKLLRFSR